MFNFIIILDVFKNNLYSHFINEEVAIKPQQKYTKRSISSFLYDIRNIKYLRLGLNFVCEIKEIINQYIHIFLLHILGYENISSFNQFS